MRRLHILYRVYITYVIYKYYIEYGKQIVTSAQNSHLVSTNIFKASVSELSSWMLPGLFSSIRSWIKRASTLS